MSSDHQLQKRISQLEHELGDLQQLDQAVLETAVDAIITIDERGTIRSFNLSAERLFGYARQEVIGKNVRILMPAPYAEEHDTYLAKYLATGQGKIIGIGREVQARRKDGSLFPADLAVSEVRLRRERLFAGFLRDKSVEKAAEAELQESQRALKTLISNLPGVAYRVSTVPLGNVLLISDGCLDVCGYPSEDFTSGKRTWLGDVVLEPDRLQLEAKMRQSIQTGDSFQAVYRIRHRNGGKRWVWEQGQLTSHHVTQQHFIEGFISDITLKKLTEETANQLAAIVESSDDAMMSIDLNGKILSWNPASERMTGYRAVDVLGRSPNFLLGPNNQRHYEIIQEHLSEGVPIRSFETVYERKDGSLIDVSLTVSPIRDTQGERIGVSTIARDITELKRSRKKLVQAERLAAIGEMLSGIAHESRNALQRIQAAVDMLQLEFEHNPEVLADLDRIEKAKDGLNTLFEDVRSYAAPITLERAVVRLPVIWQRAWNLLETQRQGRDATLTLRDTDIDLHCELDAFRMEQVFRNLLENALAACTDPTRISIEVSEVARYGEPYLEVVVSDNGPGLNAEQRVRLFEAFYTTKTRGTGLGMAIAKRIVDAHRGTITARNQPGGGAAIVIQLPRNLQR